MKLPLATLNDLRFCILQSPKQLIKSLTVILSPFTIKSTTLCCLRTLKPLADNVDASFSRTCLKEDKPLHIHLSSCPSSKRIRVTLIWCSSSRIV